MDVSNLVEVKKKRMPDIQPGDTVRVSTKIVEGDKERIQVFQGVVIKISKGGHGASYTVRHVAFGVGVERTFPMESPLVEKITVVRQGKVRRSRLYYLRSLSGKEARRKIKRVERKIREQVGDELLQEEPEEEIEPIMDEAAVAAAAEAEAAEKAKAEKAPEAKAPEAAKEEKPKAEKPAAEKAEEPKAEAPAAEKVEEPKAEAPAAEEKPAEAVEDKKEEPAADEKKAEPEA